jgi:hypothetical protein
MENEDILETETTTPGVGDRVELPDGRMATWEKRFPIVVGEWKLVLVCDSCGDIVEDPTQSCPCEPKA